MEDDASFSSSSCDDVRPQVRVQFEKLATALRDTGQNLHTFEFMLNQYRQMAKIAPFRNETDEEANPVAKKLEALTQAVETLQERGKERPEEQRDEPKGDHVWKLLEEELREERSRRVELDKKLESERRAAKIVAQDITRYVESMKSMEEQLQSQSVEKKLLAEELQRTTESLLCQTCLDRSSNCDALDAVASTAEEVRESTSTLRAELDEERRLRLEAEERRSQCERELRQHRDGLPNVLRLKLADATAERDTLADAAARAEGEALEAKSKLRSGQESLERLRAKTRILLSRYRAKKASFNEVIAKVGKIRSRLIEMRAVCEAREENHGRILDHLGSQIEITARLLAAYLKPSSSGGKFKMVGGGGGGVRPGKRLSLWFCDVQALASWTHSQMAALGTMVWTGEAAGVGNLDEKDTLSELSQTLTHDGLKAANSLVEAQDQVSKSQKDCFNSILSFLEPEELGGGGGGGGGDGKENMIT